MKKVIHIKNEKMKFPISETLILWLILDRIKPSGWIVGMAWTLMAIVWIVSIWVIFWEEEQIDIFKEKK